jgi:FkbM family methyltransferase
MITRDQVLTAYELILQRSPESESAIDYHLAFPDLRALGRHFTSSPEFKISQPKPTPAPTTIHEHHIYRGYVPSDLDVFQHFSQYDGLGAPGFVTNFLGVRTRCTLQLPLVPFDGTVEGLPEPVGSTQGETAEWIGTLRAVLEAGSSFRLMELGAGYGPWMAITHAAARQRGITDIHVYGVEADAHHVDFIRTNMQDNTIDEAQGTAIHGAVGAEDGVAYWAVEEEPGAVYGGRPMIASDGNDYLGNTRSTIVEVPVVGINGLLSREVMWDLLHIDIQGHEGEVCRAGIEQMTQCVRRVVVGTHSRIQDGIVMETFHKAGWSLENEKPTISIWNDAIPTVEGMAVVDGAQVWRNPRV